MIDVKEIQNKLVEKLRSSGWAAVLKGFIMSSDFEKVIKDLWDQVDDGKRFTPQLKLVFTAFEECSWDSLKVVIIGQDPYPQLGVADGISFSCSITEKEQPSLKYLRDAIQRTVYDPIPEPRQSDLRYLSNQGVLLLNTALTTQVDKPLTHQKIWQAFIAYVLDTINSNKKDIAFVFLGKTAQELESLVDDDHLKLMASHPASAAYNQAEEWDCKDVFNQVNKFLQDEKKGEIRW